MILWFLHGWGLDASLWAEVAALLPDFESVATDRGYFGTPCEPAPDASVLTVAHSFGALLALREMPPRCRGLVAVNGFDCFAAREDHPGVAPRIVARMVSRFDANPDAVLTDFRHRCDDDRAYASPDADLLRADLLALRDWDFRREAASLPLPILSLQGAADPILPPAMRDTVFASAPKLERATHPTAGHLLPLTDPAFCAEQIRAFAERVR